MDKIYESKYHKIEEEGWWFVSRRKMIISLIPNNKKMKILDIGCSGGTLLKSLKQKGFLEIYGIDTSKKAVELCKKNGLDKVFLRDALKTQFKDKEFDIIIASDILEHIKEDELVLIEWKRILKDDGKLIVFVPAFNFLWSNHDIINHHFRRYSKKGLTKIVKKSGFKILRSSYWNFIIFLPVSFIKIFLNIFVEKSRDQFMKINPLINRLLLTVINLENRILNRINLPIGLSIFVIAGK